MSTSLPEPLQAVIQQLATLPGLGAKSALRIAMTLLKWPESETRRLGKAISGLRDNLCLCERCGALTDSSPCEICRDPGRNRDTLCLVAEWDSLLAMEGGGFYHGQYMILGGLLAPLQNKDAADLETSRLIDRLAEGEITELILALGSTLEAENTVSFLKELLAPRFPSLSISRLAQGIPLGAELKHMDRDTLRESLRFRQSL